MVRVPLSPADVADGTMRGVRLDEGRHLLLVRLGGRLHALDDMCNHAGCLLSRGRLEGGRVVCPCHLMAFDVRTGELHGQPRLCDDQRVHRVEERDATVWVELSDT